MNKADLVSKVAITCGIPKTVAEQAVDKVLQSITMELKMGRKVNLPGFGNFVVNARAARTGRNPGTGETIEIAAANVVKFSAASALKAAINGGDVK